MNTLWLKQEGEKFYPCAIWPVCCYKCKKELNLKAHYVRNWIPEKWKNVYPAEALFCDSCWNKYGNRFLFEISKYPPPCSFEVLIVNDIPKNARPLLIVPPELRKSSINNFEAALPEFNSKICADSSICDIKRNDVKLSTFDRLPYDDKHLLEGPE